MALADRVIIIWAAYAAVGAAILGALVIGFCFGRRLRPLAQPLGDPYVFDVEELGGHVIPAGGDPFSISSLPQIYITLLKKRASGKTSPGLNLSAVYHTEVGPNRKLQCAFQALARLLGPFRHCELCKVRVKKNG